MASSLSVPDCKAATVVLEHFMEVEKWVKGKDPALDDDVSQQLMAVAEAVKELEDIRRHTRELLEVETIENSKLRYKTIHLPRIITREIEDAVASARASIAAERLQLENDLKNMTLELERTERKEEEIEKMNVFLSQQGETLWDKHQEAVDLLNQQMAGKAHQSIRVNETHNKRKEAEEAVIEYQNRTEDLAEDMATERQQFMEETERLTAEIAETRRKTEEQDARNAEKKVYLSQRKSLLYDVEEKINMEKENISSMKGRILLLQATHGRLTTKLDLQKKQSADIANKIDILQLQMANRTENFYNQSNSLKDEISKLDEQMSAAEILHESLTEKHKDLKLKYQTASEEEDRQHAIKKDVSIQLEKSRSSLNDKQELLGKLKMEITEMERNTEDLLESTRISTEQLATHVEEFKENLANERQKRMSIQIKKDEVTKEMELWKLSEEAFVTEMKKRILHGQNKKAFLTNEGSRLQREVEKWDKEICSINEELAKASEEYAIQVQSLKGQIQTLEEEIKNSLLDLENEEEKLAKNIPIMDAAEGTYNKEHVNYEDLKRKSSAMKSKQKSLEGSINKISKDIEANSKMKDTKKTSLKALRKSAFEKLQGDLDNLKLIDKDIYETNRRLELVIMENCRLKLQNAQYKDDICAIIGESEKHLSDTDHLEKDQASLIEHLHEGWDQDNLVCSDFSERDQETLDSIAELLKKIGNREEKVGNLNNILYEKFTGLSSLLQSKAGKKATASSN
ncbi:coiled-coil domain-containing protein 175 isoform 2-T3 [Anomaloglossus baeobatrachus]|uniref:coiled-coil domain-containing protein 175 isoform X2 n=1 Tax=Anomaloglossus baeobatrachus TaxID=238106 RepID=UPI003F4F74BF